MLCGAGNYSFADTATATSTAITVTSSGSEVTTVAAGSVVTLTATVNAGSTPVTPGLVKFCDAATTFCEDIHIVGTAQLTSSGTAVVKFRPGPGNHGYKAFFVGTNSYATSASPATALSVTGSYPSTTKIAKSGVPGNYTLSAAVTGPGLFLPTENVSFLDTSNGNELLGAAALGGGQTTLSWRNPQTPATRPEPGFIVAGDFNGDGIPDLALVDFADTAALTIQLGKGDGTFITSNLFQGQFHFPSCIVEGDFNGDGKADLAVGNEDGTLSLLLGNGDGTFTASTVPVSSLKAQTFIAVEDFNGDGKADLAVAIQNPKPQTDGYVAILLGNGDGTFAPAAASPSTGLYPTSIAAADFNGDGIADLAITNQTGKSISILLAQGDGTFTPAATIPVKASQPLALAIADFNGDGKADLVTVCNSPGNGVVLLGNGDGTFTPVGSPALQYAQSVAVGDFNGDGKVDLATVWFNLNTVAVLLGNGDGTFTPETGPSTGKYPWVITTGDFDGNGTSDIAAANWASNSVTILTSQLTQKATATISGVSIAGHGVHEVDASYPGDNNFAASLSVTTALTALPAKPSINWATPQAITYGIPLTSAQLNASSPVAGTFSYLPAIGTVLSGGSHPLTVTFTPTDALNYTKASATVLLTVNKATPSAQWAAPAAPISYGTALGGILNATAHIGSTTLPGTFAYTALPTGGAISAVTAATVLRAGSYVLSTTFTPTNGVDYTTATATVPLIVVPHDLVVNTTADDAGTTAGCPSVGTASCSLRAALAAAHSNGGKVTFDPAVFKASNPPAQNTITLGSAGTLAIPANTTISGPTSGSGRTLTNLVTISGNKAHGVFSVATGISAVAIANVNITNGMSNGGGAIQNGGALTVNACTFSSNTASQGQTGGAIQNTGQLTVNDSTFANNTSINAGGAIDSSPVSSSTYPTLAINNSTFSGNTGGQGGAIYNGGTLTMTNSTISGNTGSGAAIFNNGLAMGSNSILSGDTGGECAGPGCFDETHTSRTYFLVSGSERKIGSAWDSGPITLSWNDSQGNQYSYTVTYGQFSGPASIASAFGGGISNTLSPAASALGFGPFFVISIYNGASLGQFTITTPSKSFTLKRVYQSLLNSSSGNIVGPGANLSSLGNYGGPTQTMIPLAGSSAICAGSVSKLVAGVTTDQRGYANTNTSYLGYSSKRPCVDAGSVQTDYALSFTTQPPVSTIATKPFSAGLKLDESGIAFTSGGFEIPLALTGNGALLNGSASTVKAIATYPALSVSLPGSNDKLNASLTLNRTVVATASSRAFDIIAAPTRVGAVRQTIAYSASAQTIKLTASVASTIGVVNAGTVTFTVLSGASPVGTSTTSAPVVNGSASAAYTLPNGTSVGIYTISAAYNAGGAFAASSDNTQTLTVKQAVPAILWATPAAIAYGTPLGAPQLSATSPVAGTFTYAPTAGTVFGVGTHTLMLTFTPTDTKDYTTATATRSLVVRRTTPSIVWAAPSAIRYGTPLGKAQLDAAAFGAGSYLHSPVAGQFTYSFSAGTILGTGSHIIKAVFKPTDTANYSAATASVSVTVDKATPTVLLVSSANPASVSKPVTFTCTVSAAFGTPTGTVSFYDGTALLVTRTLSSGVATYPISTLTLGSHTITAVYSGDNRFVTLSSKALQETIGNATKAQ